MVVVVDRRGLGDCAYCEATNRATRGTALGEELPSTSTKAYELIDCLAHFKVPEMLLVLLLEEVIVDRLLPVSTQILSPCQLLAHESEFSLLTLPTHWAKTFRRFLLNPGQEAVHME